MRVFSVMRFRGGFDHAWTVAGVMVLAALALVIGACAGQQQQPGEYGLGAAEPATPGSPQDFTAKAGDMVQFPIGSAALTGQARTTLRRQVRWLTAYPQYRVTIVGHADEHGARRYNLALGARRATAVKRFLVRNGLRAGRIHTVSYGKERLVAECDGISCPPNRRAQTVLVGGAAARD
jgi:peptidoglycan-associated lipoprotein